MPRWLERMDKTRANVKAEIKGKCVKFTGFLFYDTIQADESHNTKTPVKTSGGRLRKKATP